MRTTRSLTGALATAIVLAVSACDSATDPNTIISESELDQDIAAASGEAVANDVADLIGSEQFAGLPNASTTFDLFGGPPGVTVNRTRTCYDDNVVQQACDAATTDSVVLTMSKDGSFTRSHTGPRGTETFTAAVHEDRTLTISGLSGTETSRVHNGTGTGNDTTEFEGAFENGTLTRHVAESSSDSIRQVTFTVPRAAGAPWPVSGSIVRNVAGEIEVTASGPNGERNETRSYTRRIVVTFDGDETAVITINSRTCTLNLGTRRITGCS